MCNDDREQFRRQCLLEEWKQSVALYIDQDKRQWDRVKMFIAVHGGLLALVGAVWAFGRGNGLALRCGVQAVLALTALGLTALTKQMVKRAHAYIILRKVQGMLVEQKLKDTLAGDHDEEWRTLNGILTTFTREHVAFMTSDDPKHSSPRYQEWWRLKDEIEEELGAYAFRPFTDSQISASMGHLSWLLGVHNLLFGTWLVLLVMVLARLVSALE